MEKHWVNIIRTIKLSYVKEYVLMCMQCSCSKHIQYKQVWVHGFAIAVFECCSGVCNIYLTQLFVWQGRFMCNRFMCLSQGQAVFPLYSAGVCVAGNCRSCPCTYRTLLSLRTFISSNSLGAAGFWLLGPGTTLGGAYGPTNTRLRCHLGEWDWHIPAHISLGLSMVLDKVLLTCSLCMILYIKCAV